MKNKNIIHINLDGDPAGVSWLLHKAMKKAGYSSHHIIPSEKQIHKLSQGTDIIIENNPIEAENILEKADLFHINGRILDTPFGLKLKKLLINTPFVFHNHGGKVLLNPYPQIEELRQFNKNFIYIACSPLTKKVIPFCRWLPNIVPIDEPLYMPIKRDFNGTLKICNKIFSKLTRIYKGTDILNEMINVHLRDEEKFPLSLDIFEELSIQDCLKKSSDYHICVDNLIQGFIGMSGWESLSKGQVVIARLDPIVEKCYKKLGEGTCPIINVTGMDEMCKVLRRFCENKELLKKKCIESRKWMEKYYTEKRIVELYIKTYEEVING